MPYFWLLIVVLSLQVNRQQPAKNDPVQISDKDYLLGKFIPANHPDFVQVASNYTDQHNIFLRKEVYDAYKRMYDAAKAEDINLRLLSATRNFEYQKDIWERKWKIFSKSPSKNDKNPDLRQIALKILKYSAMPGASRHHWGTDIDVCNLNTSYYYSPKGKKVYEWLLKNAHLYGFCQPYTSKKGNQRTGYNEEKWHWSYQPTSRVFTEKAMNLIRNTDFQSFSGSESAVEIDIVTNYISGINKDCF